MGYAPIRIINCFMGSNLRICSLYGYLGMYGVIGINCDWPAANRIENVVYYFASVVFHSDFLVFG